MSDDERVLRSFVDDGEELHGTWRVTAVDRSKGRLPPGRAGVETVAVTERRILWFEDELHEVAIDAIDGVDGEYVERQAAPPIVLAGGLVTVLGVFGSIGAFFANVGDLVVVAMPALTGVLVFFATRLFATATGREGETRSGHRLRVQTDGGPVSFWGNEASTMADLEATLAAVAGVASSVEGTTGEAEAVDAKNGEGPADEDTVDDGRADDASDDGDRSHTG